MSPRPDDDSETALSLKARTSARRRRLLVVAGAALVVGTAGLGCLLLLWIDRRMAAQAAPRIHRTAEDVPECEVALVLGAKIYSDGSLSAVLHDRVRRAVDLYKAGRVKKLLMSGDNSSPGYDEPTAMRNAAIEMGVDPDDVVRDFAGFRTLDSVHRARDLWGVHSMVIVTQRFHLPRSIYLARSLGIDAHGFSADRRGYLRARQMRVREMLARSGAWMDVNLLGTKPKFLGEPEELSGLAQEEAMGERRGDGS